MRGEWYPDEAFLSRRNKEQLAEIVREAGLAGQFSSLSSFKKSELVSRLASLFRAIREQEVMSEEEQQARSWIPGAMRFPAIDPGKNET
jgi:hypothetical protein